MSCLGCPCPAQGGPGPPQGAPHSGQGAPCPVWGAHVLLRVAHVLLEVLAGSTSGCHHNSGGTEELVHAEDGRDRAELGVLHPVGLVAAEPWRCWAHLEVGTWGRAEPGVTGQLWGQDMGYSPHSSPRAPPTPLLPAATSTPYTLSEGTEGARVGILRVVLAAGHPLQPSKDPFGVCPEVPRAWTFVVGPPALVRLCRRRRRKRKMPWHRQ